MKKIDLAILEHDKVFDARDAMRAVLRAFGIDPDAEHVEPAKPEAARWWEVGERILPGSYHDEQGIVSLFVRPFSILYHRLHGPHPTEQAAREHYEASKERCCSDPDCPDARGYGKVHPAPAPQPTAEEWNKARAEKACLEYDIPVRCAWALQQIVLREREKWAEEKVRLAQAVHSAQSSREDARALLDAVFAIVSGEPDSFHMLPHAEVKAARTLRADRDRLAAELAALKPTPTPTVDYAGLVERAHRHVNTTCQYFSNKYDGLDVLRRELAQLVSDLAEALAAGGGK